MSFGYADDFGCTNQNACNYNPNAIEDDGSCLFIDCIGECGGNNFDCCDDLDSNQSNNCPIDCTGCLGGDAFIDDCGNCVGGTTSDELQECGSSPCLENWAMDCNGDCSGQAFLDECNVCSGGDSNHTANSDIDCNGDCFGDAQLDDCGECDNNSNNDNLSCSGCINVNACNYNPEAIVDDGSCLYFDCSGVCGGDALIDDCGTCSCPINGISDIEGCSYGIIQNFNGDDVGCGCSGEESGINPENYFYDEDNDSLGYGEATIFCPEFDWILTDNTIYEQVPDGWVLNNFDQCPIDFENDADSDGICGDIDECPYDAENDADLDGI